MKIFPDIDFDPTKNILCLLTREPNALWLNFLNTFNHYNVYMIVDSVDTQYHNSDIPIVSIDDYICHKNGYKFMSQAFKKNITSWDITSWDKCLYFLHHSNLDYNKVWIIEDDVFLYNEQVLLDIDNTYPEHDMLSSQIFAQGETAHADGTIADYSAWVDAGFITKNWFWPKLHMRRYTKPPYYHNLNCAARFSKNLIDKTKKYPQKFYNEALFSTTCIQNNFTYKCIEELQNIIYRHNWKPQDINKKYLYHPIKDIASHADIRKKLSNLC